MRRQLMILGTPQQNGVAEQRNRTLLEMARSMTAHANLSINFWRDTLLTTTCIINYGPSKSMCTTPYGL